MKIINDCTPDIKNEETVITIGTFDGVHKGHQKILKRLEEVKQIKKLKSVVFTFHPHPRKIVSQQSLEIKILTDYSEKIQLLSKYNIDYLIFCPFTPDFANMLPEEFVLYLVKHLNIKHIIIGYDHKFGKNRTGDIHTFLRLQSEYKYEVEQIPPETINEINISSTKIRNFLLNGDVENANELLGYRYFITGKVIEGKKLGKTIGIPTANIQVNDKDKLIPANGVYCCEVFLEGKNYKGAMNIGINPTTDDDNQRKLEVHIIGWNKDIYHQEIKVELIKKIRNEQKFTSVDALKLQILQDIQFCEKCV